MDEAARTQTGAQDGIIRHPRPSQPLARRWAWAVEEIGARGGWTRAWIAWSVPARLSAGRPP